MLPGMNSLAVSPTAIQDSELLQWFVVYSKPRKEASAQLHLQHRGIHVFAPKVLLPECLGTQRRLVALFPNYLFVKIRPLQDYYAVLWSPGVSRFVTSQAGVPARLDEGVVAVLMERADTRGIITARPDLKVGQSIEVTRGPFDGLIGIITKPPDSKGRVKVLMQLLNRQPVKVDVPVHSLRATWVV